MNTRLGETPDVIDARFLGKDAVLPATTLNHCLEGVDEAYGIAWHAPNKIPTCCLEMLVL